MAADTGSGQSADEDAAPVRGSSGDAAAVHAEAAAQPAQQPGPRAGIVVGHDGSADADRALEVALDLADGLAVPVTIVRAWTIDTAPRPATWEFGYVSSYSDYARAVTDRLTRDTQALVGRYPRVTAEYRVALGGPAKALIEVSRGSRMLVVGSRGRGGLAGMLLGSVSEQCVRHADCPVLVVRPRS